MAAAITLSQTTVARGGVVAIQGTGFKPGRTVVKYINGHFAGVEPTGPGGTAAYGAFKPAADMFVPGSGNDGIPAAAAEPVAAIDNTDDTAATATLTTT